MRILFLATDAYGSNGGIAKFNRDLIKAMIEYKNCEEIIALPFNFLTAAQKISKLKYIQSPKKKFFYVLNVLKHFFYLRKNDIILCGHINFTPLAYLLHYFSRTRFIFIIYGIDAWKPNRSAWVNLLIKKAHAFISISQFSRDKFLSWSNLTQCNYILPCCVDTEVFFPGEKKEELIKRYDLRNKKVVLTMARLASTECYKGIDEILEVMPDLLMEYPNLVYMICGSGDDEKRMDEKVKRLGVQNNVIFAGFIKEDEKVDHYRLADVFVMPGHGEGFGVVYLEAIACGVPVIGSKLDGSQEALMHGKLGALVDPTNRERLKKAIIEALIKQKGVIPDNLDYFSYQNFEKRTHSILQKITDPAIS